MNRARIFLVGLLLVGSGVGYAGEREFLQQSGLFGNNMNSQLTTTTTTTTYPYPDSDNHKQPHPDAINTINTLDTPHIFNNIITLAEKCKNVELEQKKLLCRSINLFMDEVIERIAQEKDQDNTRINLLRKNVLRANSTDTEIGQFLHTINRLSEITAQKLASSQDFTASKVLLTDKITTGAYWSTDLADQITYITHFALSAEIKVYLLQLMWWSLVRKTPYEITKESPAVIQTNLFTIERRAIYCALQKIKDDDAQSDKPKLTDLTRLLPEICTENNHYYPIIYNHKFQNTYVEHLNSIPPDSDAKEAYTQFLATFKQWLHNSQPTQFEKTITPNVSWMRTEEEIKRDLQTHLTKISSSNYLRIANPTGKEYAFDTERQKIYLRNLHSTIKQTQEKLQHKVTNGPVLDDAVIQKAEKEELQETQNIRTQQRARTEALVAQQLIQELKTILSLPVDYNQYIARLSELPSYMRRNHDNGYLYNTHDAYIDSFYNLAKHIEKNNNQNIPDDVKEELNEEKHINTIQDIARSLPFDDAPSSTYQKIWEMSTILIQYKEYNEKFTPIHLLLAKNEAITLLKKAETVAGKDSMATFIYTLDKITFYLYKTKNRSSDITDELSQEKYASFLSAIVENYTNLDETVLVNFKDSCQILGENGLEKFSQAKQTIENKEYAVALAKKIKADVSLSLACLRSITEITGPTSGAFYFGSPPASNASRYIDSLQTIALHINDVTPEMKQSAINELTKDKHIQLLKDVKRFASPNQEATAHQHTKLQDACTILAKQGTTLEEKDGCKEFSWISYSTRDMIDNGLKKRNYFTSDEEYNKYKEMINLEYTRPKTDKKEREELIKICDKKHTNSYVAYQAAYKKIARKQSIKVDTENDKTIDGQRNQYISLMLAHTNSISTTKGFFATFCNFLMYRKIINNFEAMKKENLIPTADSDNRIQTIETKIANYKAKSWWSTIVESFHWLFSWIR